jgi:hypothetical protein
MVMAILNILGLCLLLALFIQVQPAQAENISEAEQSEDAELANELNNPLADLMIFPIQMNYDKDIGPRDDGWRLRTDIQPVIPFHLTESWNFLSRTVIPVTYQEDVDPDEGSQFGLGDILQGLFFTPKNPTSGGIIWGAGPILLLPTATNSSLGTKKWGAGPTAIVLTSREPWTVGVHANHVWSFAGDSDRANFSNTLVQPFVAYTWPSAWSASVQSESIYNWKAEQWAVPVTVAVAKLVRWGKLPVRLQAGVGYWVESQDAGPEGFRFLFQMNFVLPR